MACFRPQLYRIRGILDLTNPRSFGAQRAAGINEWDPILTDDLTKFAAFGADGHALD